MPEKGSEYCGEIFNCNFFFYDAEGLLVREEAKDIFGTTHDWKTFHYTNGMVDSIFCYEGKCDLSVMLWRTILFEYDDYQNVAKSIVAYNRVDKDSCIPIDTIVREQFYEYDHHLQPHFGMDYLLAFQPLSGMDNLFIHERLLSVNNMTEAITNIVTTATTYNYTYNEHGLPETYQRFCNGSQSAIFRIHYKPIATGVSDLVLSEIKIYPNPTTDNVHLSFIEKTGDISLSVCDITGRELFRKIIKDGACDVDLSDFNAGVFLFKITSADYSKVIKIIKLL
jgi:hypothetical protein